MCGIIGIVGLENAASSILEGLKRLEYRGYDSAGIATIEKGALNRRRAEGKLTNLDALITKEPLPGSIGIGHTRWAPHGVPSEANAHPHMTDKVAVVHNGIIENYRELKEEMQKAGHAFHSQTDTEVIAVLLTHYLGKGQSPQAAIQSTLGKLHGAFALAIIFKEKPDLLVAARHGAPLAIGYGKQEMYLGSDAIALAPFTSRLSYLEDGDWAEITASSVTIHDATGKQVEREIRISTITGDAIGKGNHRHFMHKEIYEQPSAVAQTLSVYYHPAQGDVGLPKLPFALKDISRVSLVACGTSYYAAMIAKYWLETYTGLAVTVDFASEFRYRTMTLEKNELSIFISQSGETADTLAAMRAVKKAEHWTLSIVNAPESSLANESHAVMHTYAGPEISVASTKGFTTQLVTLACLALAIGNARGKISAEKYAELMLALAELPSHMSEMLQYDEQINSLAAQIAPARDVLYMGRGTCFPVALEGALKLKELSYIHAEGYAAGELKHGPIALIDDKVPVIALAPSDAWFEKTASNIQEVAARGGKIILISDEEGIRKLGSLAIHSIRVPRITPFTAPLLYALPVQLLAYHTAVHKGTDVDQPRNLAKSVTVE